MNTEAIHPLTKVSFIRSIARRLPMTIFWALAAQAIISITRLLTTMTVGGRFAPESTVDGAMLGSASELGYYSSAFGVLMIIMGMHEGLVTTPMTVFLPKQRAEKEKTFSGNMLLASMLFIGSVVVLATLAWMLGSAFRSSIPLEYRDVFSVLLVVAALAPFQVLREFSRRWLLANLKVHQSAYLEILFSVLFLTALGILIWTANVSAIAAFIIIAIVNIVALLVWWFCYRSQFELQPETSGAQLSENFRYGRWVAGENLCSVVTMYFCNWFLLFQIGEQSAGVFFACFSIMLLANPFLLGVCSLLGARTAQEFTSGGWSAMLKTLTQYGAFVVSILIGFSVGLWFLGPELTNLFFGQKYQAYFDANFSGVNQVTSILGLAIPFLGCSFVLTTALLAVGRPNDSFISAIVGMLVLLGMNFCFSEPTLVTAAYSFVAATVANTVFRATCLWRAWRMRSKNSTASDS